MIGIPTFNRDVTIARAVRSALAQTFKDLQVVVADNASTDGTESICRSLAIEDDRIHYVRHGENVGLTANFNSLFSMAQSEYAMILADDDWLQPDYIDQCVSVLDTVPHHSVVSGRTLWHPSWIIPGGRGVDVNLTHRDPTRRVRRYFAEVSDNVPMYGVMRRSMLTSALPMDNVFGGDWLLVARLAFQGEVSTLPHTWINRSIGGLSSNYRRMNEEMNVSGFETRHPHFALASSIYRDIAWRSPVYSSLRPAQRCAFGAWAACGMVRGHFLEIAQDQLAPLLQQPGMHRLDALLRSAGRRFR